MDIWSKVFMARVVKPWPRLPREAVDAPSLETSQARLDGAPSNLTQAEDVPAHGRGVGLDDL